MRIAVTGSSGLIGQALSRKLKDEGHEVLPVVRQRRDDGTIHWDPSNEQMSADKLEQLDALIHLAGENIAQRRWSEAQKQRILDSRVTGTRFISETLAGLSSKPKVFVSASAIGYYGDHRELPVDESSDTGEGFLAEVCRSWEAACKPARDAGIRTVNPRIGVVLSKRGGALAKMLPPFRMCVGGVIGNGKQVWSWVSINDVVGAIVHAIEHDSIHGPLNVTSPDACTNAEFTKALGHVLGRPTIVPLPAFAARLALGEMADALLLSSCRVIPGKLAETGYEFRHPHLEACLRALLK
jgi:uncharacterized protein (TIGR01777 family)